MPPLAEEMQFTKTFRLGISSESPANAGAAPATLRRFLEFESRLPATARSRPVQRARVHQAGRFSRATVRPVWRLRHHQAIAVSPVRRRRAQISFAAFPAS